jgi:hypothetical protein
MFSLLYVLYVQGICRLAVRLSSEKKVATKHKASSSLVIQSLRLLRTVAIAVVLLGVRHRRRSLVVERRRHKWSLGHVLQVLRHVLLGVLGNVRRSLGVEKRLYNGFHITGVITLNRRRTVMKRR